MDDVQTPSTGRFRFVTRGRGRSVATGISLRSPYGMQIIENCVTCPLKESRLFCNLAPAALQRLSEITASEHRLSAVRRQSPLINKRSCYHRRFVRIRRS
jgi:hypothetical protein